MTINNDPVPTRTTKSAAEIEAALTRALEAHPECQGLKFLKVTPLEASALMVAVSAASAAGFGVGLGTPLEERVGGDYGPEYYSATQANRLAKHRGTGRCRTKQIETPSRR
jgi:hypothetical protein